MPLSIKYCYKNATDTQINRALQELEAALNLQSGKDDFYMRLRNIGDRVLTNLEIEYRVSPIEPDDWNRRIEHLRKRMLDYCEEKLDLIPATTLPVRERVYKIQSILWFRDRQERQPGIDYEHIDRTTVRLLNFDAIYDGYVAANPTKERFFATIDRLEREVFNLDRPKFKGWRRAIVKIGTPIDLKEYFLDTLGEKTVDRQQIIARLTDTAQQIVQANLN